MNPKKTERWPIPAGTRHVWIMQKYRYEIPVQGYVIDRKKQGSEWVALVAYMDTHHDDQALIQRWLPMRKLKPVHSRPEDDTTHGPF